MNMDVSIIIVNWNTKRPLLECLESVFMHSGGLTFDVTVVDNGSWDGSVEAVRKRYPRVAIIANSANLGFSRANNQAITSTSGKYCLFLNSDAELTSQALEKMVEFMEYNPRVGIAGGRLLNTDGSMQNSFDNIPTLTTELLNKSLLRVIFPRKYPSKKSPIAAPLDVESVIGACMLIRRKALDEVGLFDEDYFLFLEETDLAVRMRKAGWKIVHEPRARAVHLQGATANTFQAEARIEFYRSRYLFFQKHYGGLTRTVLTAVLTLNLTMNLLFLGVASFVTLGRIGPLSQSLRVRAALWKWHMQGCPASSGLPRK